MEIVKVNLDLAVTRYIKAAPMCQSNLSNNEMYHGLIYVELIGISDLRITEYYYTIITSCEMFARLIIVYYCTAHMSVNPVYERQRREKPGFHAG